MVSPLDAWARFHDAWVGVCSVCGEGCRRVTCSTCRRAAALNFRVEGVPGWSAAPYGGRVGELIRRLKYHDETRWAGPLGRLLQERAGAFISPHVTLIPVPLHPRRLAERGYNQSALLARSFGRGSKMRVNTAALRRARWTSAQAELGARERHSNMLDAFEAREPPAGPLVLLDDVTTTGATLRECVLCLRRAGAIVQAVVTVALARADELPADRPSSLLPP